MKKMDQSRKQLFTCGSQLLHEAAFSESMRLSVEASRVRCRNIEIRNISLKNLCDIEGGLFL